MEQIRFLVHFATGGLNPDLTVLLDVDVEEGLKRKKEAGGEWNRMDAQFVEFHQRVRNGYLEMAKNEPGRWKVVDANQSMESTYLDLKGVILCMLGLKGIL